MTPTARDFKDGDGTANVETNGLLGRQAPRTVMPGQESQNDTGQRLNPIFVTALMGWREGWLDLTNSESSATE
jgi:ferric-dicitrate binding protein FerR (iron transport regulator)